MLMSFLGPKKERLLTFSGRQHFQRRNPNAPGTWSFPPRSTESWEAGACKKEKAMKIKSPSSCYCRKPSPEVPVLSPRAVPPHLSPLGFGSNRPSLPLPPRYILLPLAAPGCVHFRPSSSSWSSRSSRVGCIVSRDEFWMPATPSST